MTNPKLEFYKFKLKPKKGTDKTFRDFAIEELGGRTGITNDAAFKKCFEHFIKGLATDHAKSEKKKKTITIISNPRTNPFLHHKPTILIDKYLVVGVINGGPYDKDAIVSDISDKERNSKLGRNNSVLLPYFILLYLPPDYHEGCFAVHSNSSEETITAIFRSYVSNVFSGKEFYKAVPEAFCPKSFQDEFRRGATIKNLTFTTSITEARHSTDPIQSLLHEYSIKIEAIPKNKDISIREAEGVLNFFKRKIFQVRRNKDIQLDEFESKKLVAENEVTNKTKVFEWNTKDQEFVPAVYLEGRIRLEDGLPDFQELKDYCENIFDDEILPEIRKDLNARKVR